MLLHRSQHVRVEKGARSSTIVIDDAHQGDVILRREEVRNLVQQTAREALQEVDAEVDGEAAQAGEEDDLVGVEVFADVALRVLTRLGLYPPEDSQRHVDARGRLAGEGDGVGGTSEVVLRGEECSEGGGFRRGWHVGW